MNNNKHSRLSLVDIWLIMINRNSSMVKQRCYLDANISEHNWIDESWCKHPNVSNISSINSGMIARRKNHRVSWLYCHVCQSLKLLIVMLLSLQIFNYHSFMILTKYTTRRQYYLPQPFARLREMVLPVWIMAWRRTGDKPSSANAYIRHSASMS